MTVNGDEEIEDDESFGVAISNVAGATYDDAGSDPVAIILDDDGDPDLSVYGPSTYEGDSGATEFTFDAYLTRVADTDVTFEWSTLDGDAAAGSDYVAAVDRGATIPAGQASATFTVTVNGDEEIEDDESFGIAISNVAGATYDDAGERSRRHHPRRRWSVRAAMAERPGPKHHRG